MGSDIFRVFSSRYKRSLLRAAMCFIFETSVLRFLWLGGGGGGL